MKVRQGFVSNSSSTSFYIDANKYTEDTIKEIVKKLLEAYNLINTEYHEDYTTYSDFCDIYETDQIKYLVQKTVEFANYNMSKKDQNILVNAKIKEWPDKLIVIDSVSDNSIPWSIQNFLEDVAWSRHHWG